MKKRIIILAVLSLLVIALAIACDSSVYSKLLGSEIINEEPEKPENYLTFCSAKSFNIKPSYDGQNAKWGKYVNSKKIAGILEYSTDSNTWIAFATNKVTSATSVQGTDGNYYLYIRGKDNSVISEGYKSDKFRWIIKHINTQDKDGVSCSGNIMTLLDYDNPSDAKMADYCFGYLFSGCKLLTSSPNLPALSLTKQCYQKMFANCTSLTDIPADLLPATVLKEACYYAMFEGSGLTSIPENLLSATKLAVSCYSNMFKGCKGLTSVPENLLPSTTLANKCYMYMFRDCINLTNAPNLPALSLKGNCYQNMFMDCKKLTDIPADLLPATVLATGCYSSMFQGSGLTSIPENLLSATNLAESCYSDMFRECKGLTSVPKNLLPSTKLATNCYMSMFQGCINLTNAPNLPATSFASYCYGNMFNCCTKLKVKIKESDQDNVFLTIPAGVNTSEFDMMFHGIGAKPKATPEAGKSYAWYLDD